MQRVTAARAYQAAARHRSQRDQDADVFRRVNAALRAALGAAGSGDRAVVVRALSDNRLLWMTVATLARDPANPLPAPLRGQLVSVGLAVAREMEEDAPDLPFLIAINEDVAAGLSGPAQ